MKLDDRDIIDQPSYEPLSNAELVAHIETYAGLIYDMPLAERGRWQGDIVGPARVLLARAEAAEAEAYERLEAALFAEQRATDAEMERDELAARVDELEAERAAQQWRPVTADWPPRNQRVVISAPGASWADVARKQHDGEEYVWQLKNGHMLDFESATVAIPLPPAPAPQEPTP